MLSNKNSSRSSHLTIWVALGGVVAGIVAGFGAGVSPLLLVLLLIAVIVPILFFRNVEQAVLAALIFRSAIDTISSPPLPSAFAIAIDILTLIYVVVLILQRKPVQTDWLWWFLAGWVLLQGMWVILLPLGGLGMDASFLSNSIREWVRLFSWLMMYLLVMQLKGRILPQRLITILFWSLLIPLTVAFLQIFVPSILPANLGPLTHSALPGALSEGSRIRGTIGHPNGFATYIFLFIALTNWKLNQSKQRFLWVILLGLLAFFYVSTKALFSLMMLGVFILVLIAPKLNLLNLIGAVFLFGAVILLFGSTEFGQERLGSISQTPLLNPNIDVWRAILLSYGDGNSFNWRIAQWNELLQAWQQYPILGYGLGLTKDITSNSLEAHNDYVRSLVEGGVVGFVAFLSFFAFQIARIFQLIRKAVPNSPQHSFNCTLLAVIIAIPVGMITENIWTHTMLFFYWFTLLAVAGWDWNEVENKHIYSSSE